MLTSGDETLIQLHLQVAAEIVLQKLYT